MYIIMYKYSAFKIKRKSFPNNIKNPIAPAQRKQSPPSPSSPGPDRGSHSEQERHHPLPALI